MTPDEDVKKVLERGDIAIINSDATEKHYYYWGSGSATLTQEHIDALLAGHTLTFKVQDEYQVCISFEK